MGTFFTGALLLILAAAALRVMIRNKKNGRAFSCGGDCSRCGGGCRIKV
ncbi:MAG: FeoB-associated Cys-rich membrane protein [Lachnospiraceae bacterium]|nr:FeoB-associated Cys-rich membrane protein [Lachnospiraceae bacterium]